MKYTRSQINKAGKALLEGPEKGFPYFDASQIVDDWRSLHMRPLEELVSSVTSLLSESNVVAAFSSHRLKRMTSIVAKLRHSPGMGLGGVQDIGGARFVFEDIGTLIKARDIIASAHFDFFIQDREVYDYVTPDGIGPKPSGYRSIHFVYKYVSDNPIYDGLRIELQLRTRLQHDWAMAVETGELISHSPLKAGIGDKQWLDFFKLASAIFAQKEGMPVEKTFADYSEKDFCTEYAKIDKEHRIFDQLRGLVSAVQITEQHSLAMGYAVIYNRFREKMVQLRHYPSDGLEDATKYYSDVEKTIDNSEAAVVLVSVSDMKELKEAYPSYFLNAGEFVMALREFTQVCKAKNYI
ncbi:MAG: RelA/SpoT domain-containing protein [Bacteroidales bacterium]|nr:RelA/SpoT domain-containing protein [Bacteroidales bacterium]